MSNELREALKPCPFCGSPAELERDSDHHGEWFNLGCSKHWGKVDPDKACQAGRMFYTAAPEDEPKAIAAWNARSALAAQETSEGWQDISTAPKDGTSLWLFCPDESPQQVSGAWEDHADWSGWMYDDEALANIAPEGPTPTHWRHLLTPPSSLTENSNG